MRNVSIPDPRTSRIHEYDRYEEPSRIQSPSGVINIKQEIKPETSINPVDNLVASYVDSTTFLHSPTTIQHSPMEMQGSVLVSGQSSVSLTSEELSPDELTSSSGHSRMIDPMINMSGMGMVNPNAVTNRRLQESSDDVPSELIDTRYELFLFQLVMF